MVEKRRVKLIITLGLIASFLLFMLYWEVKTKRDAAKTLETHAAVIADALWKVDSESPRQYLKLATKYDNYRMINVYLYPQDDPFISVEGDQLKTLHNLLIKAGLIRLKELETEVYYKNINIGRIAATRCINHLDIYSYWLFASLLVGISLYNLINTVLQKKDLEQAVKKTTEDFEESQKRYRTLVKNIPGVTYRCLFDQERTMLFISDEFDRLTGYEGTEFIMNKMKSFTSIMETTHPEANIEAVRKAVKEREPFIIEYDIIAKDGSVHQIYDKGQGIYNDQGQLKYIDGVLIDISEKNRMVKEKADLEEQYHHAQKMESIGRLAGGMAHDLNNLLTPVLGYSDLLAAELHGNKEVLKYTDEIIKASLSARELIQQLLSYSRKQRFVYKQTDVNEVLISFKSLLRETLHESITLHFNLDRSLPTLLADRIQLEQIVMNLSVNAQDAMEGGGTLTISTSQVTKRDVKHVWKDPLEAERYVKISFADTGSGISDEVLEHIFEPFYSTKGTRGTGLGLATVFGIAKHHKGSISVDTALSKGTTINIFLPLSEYEE